MTKRTKRTNFTKKDHKKFEQFAGIKFKPMKIPLEKLPTNETFGKHMLSIRIAAVCVNEKKARLIEIARDLDDGKEFRPESGLRMVIEDIEQTRDVLKAFTEMLTNAHARLIVATHAFALELERGQ